MLVKVLTTFVDGTARRVRYAGEVFSCEDDVGAAWEAVGFVREASEPIEEAVRSAPEHAVFRKKGRR